MVKSALELSKRLNKALQSSLLVEGSNFHALLVIITACKKNQYKWRNCSYH